MQSKASQNARVGIIVGLLLIAVVAIWWQTSYTSPENAFNDMLSNNLTTTSVTKRLANTTNSTSVSQDVNVQLGATDASKWHATINNGKQEASTESIGMPIDGYIRYTHIDPLKKTNEPIINVWAKSDQYSSELKRLFANSLLDMSSAPVPPLGQVADPYRKKLIDFSIEQKVFKPNYSKVTTSIINGRTAYNIPVDVALAPYILMMQGFAHYYGLKTLDTIKASDYASSKPVAIILSVDKLSHQMVRIVYPPTGFSETFNEYGIARDIEIPSPTISERELQARVTAAP